jgi:hypothetical protein
MLPIAEWQTFYEVVGSATAALIGLQFVTMALVADMPLGPEDSQAGPDFSTPTIVHFSAVLLLAATSAMPWHNFKGPAILWGAIGTLGALYIIRSTLRLRAQHAYKVVLEDWLLRSVAPLIGYASLIAFSFVSRCNTRAALFGIAATALLLLFIGIHNAWDNVTYIVFVKKHQLK